MSDAVSDVQASTNGTQGLEAGIIHAASIEDRLAALRETIRTWNWRASVLEASPASAEEPAPVVSSVHTAAPAHLREEPVHSSAVTGAPDEVRGESAFIDEEPVRVDEVPIPPPAATPQESEGEREQPVAQAAQAAQAAHAAVPLASEELQDQSGPQAVDPSPPARVETLAAPAISETQAAAPEGDSDDVVPSRAPKHGAKGPLARMWSLRWIKVVALCLAVIVAVLVIIGALRLVHTNPSPISGLTVVTQNTPSQAGATTTITAAQLARYKAYTDHLNTASAAAKTKLSNAGSAPTLAQVTPVTAAYLRALKLYNLQLHSVQWPSSMQADVANDEAQLGALMEFVPSVTDAGTTGMATWISQLQAQASSMQTADNKIHQDLGLPASSTLP
jgi:hypothetical protein